MTERWVRLPAVPGNHSVVEVLDGKAWYELPPPPRWHRCTPATRGWTGEQGLTYGEMCRCGARRVEHGPWENRNTRRTGRKQKPAPRWVLRPTESVYELEIHDLGGVHWYEAPVPHPFHRCTPQTRGYVRFDYIERCACGAARYSRTGPWARRNDRRNR